MKEQNCGEGLTDNEMRAEAVSITDRESRVPKTGQVIEVLWEEVDTAETYWYRGKVSSFKPNGARLYTKTATFLGMTFTMITQILGGLPRRMVLY